MIKTADLAREVVRVLQFKVVQERNRWAALMQHERGYEAWWQAEVALALENWCWVFRGGGPRADIGFVTEARPARFGLGGPPKGAIDLLVGPWSDEIDGIASDATPRVWIELKNRGDWWAGTPVKVFGAANSGLAKDLEKWDAVRWTPDDVALAFQLLSYRKTYDEPHLEPEWLSALADAAGGRKPFVEPLVVGYPLDQEIRDCIFLRVDVFPIHVPRHG